MTKNEKAYEVKKLYDDSYEMRMKIESLLEKDKEYKTHYEDVELLDDVPNTLWARIYDQLKIN